MCNSNDDVDEIEDCYKGITNSTETCDGEVDFVCGMNYMAATELSVKTLERKSFCQINRQCRKIIDTEIKLTSL